MIRQDGAVVGGCVRDVITKAPLVSCGKREIEARYFNIFPSSVELSFCEIRKDATKNASGLAMRHHDHYEDVRLQKYLLTSK